MYIYILKCKDNSLYTGITTDIKRRLRQHAGVIRGGAKYTRSHKVLSVEALWETDSQSAARKLECALKKLTKIKKLELIASPSGLTEKFCPELSEYEFVYADPSAYSEEVTVFSDNKSREQN